MIWQAGVICRKYYEHGVDMQQMLFFLIAINGLMRYALIQRGGGGRSRMDYEGKTLSAMQEQRLIIGG